MILSAIFDPVLCRVRLSASGLDVLNSNAFFEVNVSGWAPVQGTFARSTVQAHEGVASGLLTPNGTGSVVAVETTPSVSVAVTPGQKYTLSGWFLSPTGWGQTSITVTWLDAANATISTPAGTVQALPAGVWTRLTDTVTAPLGAAKGLLRARLAGTPAASNLLYIDEMKFGLATVNVERSTDGVRWKSVRGGLARPVVEGSVFLDDYEFDV